MSFENSEVTTKKACSSDGRDACSSGLKWWKTTRQGKARTRMKRLRRSAKKILDQEDDVGIVSKTCLLYTSDAADE